MGHQWSAGPWDMARIKAANASVGGVFFSRDTMRHWGDSLKSFRAHDLKHLGVYIERIRPWTWPDGRPGCGVGTLWQFDREDARIVPLSLSKSAQARGLIEAARRRGA